MRTKGPSNSLGDEGEKVTKVAKLCQMQLPATVISKRIVRDDIRPDVFNTISM